MLYCLIDLVLELLDILRILVYNTSHHDWALLKFDVKSLHPGKSAPAWGHLEHVNEENNFLWQPRKAPELEAD